MVDIHSHRYQIARRYMIRLRRDDFEDPHELAKFAATCKMTIDEFRQSFEYLVADEPPPLDIDLYMSDLAKRLPAETEKGGAPAAAPKKGDTDQPTP